MTSFNKLLNVFKKQFCGPPTMVMSLIVQAADNLIDFQVLQRIFFSVQNELLCSRALPYSPLSREKG